MSLYYISAFTLCQTTLFISLNFKQDQTAAAFTVRRWVDVTELQLTS